MNYTFYVRIGTAKNPHLRALQPLGEDLEHNLLIFVMWSKLPHEAKIYLDERKVEWKMEILHGEITTYVEARCANASDDMRAGNTSTESVLVSGIHTFFSNNSKRRCVYCKSVLRWSDQCSVHTSIEARTEVLKGRCKRCLRIEGPEHNSSRLAFIVQVCVSNNLVKVKQEKLFNLWFQIHPS